MSSEDDANKVIKMIKLVGPYAAVFLSGAISGYFFCKLIEYLF